MNRAEREAAVRRVMADQPVPVPPELYPEAVRRGERLLRRGRLVRRVMWLLVCVAIVGFGVWAAYAQPWVEPPSQTTPPVNGW
ncbi:hypothetical protein Shyhy01_67100 [Streptomyces hygroscopicus subsp. hygroscopicus]|uniref:hypothetical protein n=1 Tax=Streptomyces sp. KHY 26 TaxID=3097359 RepID=UPI0024A43BC5|nr:hypothetical protein [Streptomyces hygroscopicus]GLX53761.1 hypothetical protein Shyhy01_67100 [Streptomyces hygroscopicus subsp. hygroscopicus]